MVLYNHCVMFHTVFDCKGTALFWFYQKKNENCNMEFAILFGSLGNRQYLCATKSGKLC